MDVLHEEYQEFCTTAEADERLSRTYDDTPWEVPNVALGAHHLLTQEVDEADGSTTLVYTRTAHERRMDPEGRTRTETSPEFANRVTVHPNGRISLVETLGTVVEDHMCDPSTVLNSIGSSAPPHLVGTVGDVLTRKAHAPRDMPLVAHYRKQSTSSFSSVSAGLVEAFVGTKDVPALAARLFGAGNVRKDVVKALAQADVMAVDIALALFGDGTGVPVDWVVTFLNGCASVDNLALVDVTHPRTRAMLSGLEPNTKRNLMTRRLEGKQGIAMVDTLLTAWCFLTDPPTRARSWTHLEEQVLRTYHRINQADTERRAEQARAARTAREDWLLSPAGAAWAAKKEEAEARRLEEVARQRALEVEKVKELHAARVRRFEAAQQVVTNLHVPGLRIVVPTQAGDLEAWSEQMSNCIHSYASRWEQCASLLLAVLDARDKMLVNVEIAVPDDDDTPLRVVQARAKHNKDCPDHVRRALERPLNDLLGTTWAG